MIGWVGALGETLGRSEAGWSTNKHGRGNKDDENIKRAGGWCKVGEETVGQWGMGVVLVESGDEGEGDGKSKRRR